MIKKRLSILLILMLLALQSFPTYAAATPSNADVATSSNALLDYDILYDNLLSFASVPKATDSDAAHMIGDDVLAISSDAEILVPWAQVSDTSTGEWVANVRGTLSYSNSDRAVYEWAILDDNYYYSQIFYQVDKASGYLPTPGTYGLCWSFEQASLGTQFIGAKVFVRSTQSGVATEDGTTSCDFDVINDDTYFVASCNVQIGYHTNTIQCLTKIKPTNALEISIPATKPLYFTFSQFEGSASVVAPDISSGSGTADNITSDTVIDIGNNTASIKDTLKELILHISNQLAALWDQMYNFMHLPHLANDDKNTQTIVDTLTGGLSVEVENNNAATKEIIANQDKNTAEIKENQDKNADAIMNSYDKSKADSLASDIADSAEAYYDGIYGAIEDVQDYLNPDLIPDSFDSNTDFDILLALQVFGSWLQLLFESLGAFNIPITVSLTMIFVLILVGYYRIRSA